MDRRNDERSVKALGKVRSVLLGVIFVIVLLLSPLRLVTVTGRSMQPTLRSGETYVLDQFYWRAGGVRRNDIVVVQRGEEQWIKRLVGMPGDQLQITYREDGWITAIDNLTTHPEARRQDGREEVRSVGPGEIFIIGDNLNRSMDSTTQESGAFRLKDVVGVVRTFSFRREFPFQQHAR
jgi:signal peptidase I